jgi:hypothetical protein
LDFAHVGGLAEPLAKQLACRLMCNGDLDREAGGLE